MIAPISDQNITIGRNATFLCNVTDGDDGSIMYSWERDAVSLSDDGRITGTETDTLIIVDVTDSDEGMYTCIATNGGGNSTSTNPAMLTIRKSQYSTSTVVPTYKLMQTLGGNVKIILRPTYNYMLQSETALSFYHNMSLPLVFFCTASCI